jgi:cell shape-determining protein MreC
MWVALPFEVDPLLLRSSAVVADGRLLGRVVDAPGVVRVAQVETVADPLFRVRFRSATTQGIAAGSGQKDAEGQALLEVEHLETSEELPLGAALFTAGGDGIYPPGVLVGEVCAAASEAAGGRTLVRAAADAEPPMRLFVVCDLARRELMGVVLGAPGDGAAPEATGR